MLEPDWLASNAYRILGVAVRAGPKDVHEAAAALRRSASLNMLKPLATDPPALKSPDRNEANIRAAVGRLENPAQRLQDRLFWFNGGASGEGMPGDPAIAHDAALQKLIGAAQAGLTNSAIDLWAEALMAWNAALADEAFWDWFEGAEIEADFEPPALPSEVDALRGGAILLAGAPLISLGRTALASGDVGLAAGIAACLDSLSSTGAWATAAVSELCEPTLVDMLARCKDVREAIDASIIREPNQAAHNAGPCAAVLLRLRNEVTPGLDFLQSLAPRDSDALLRARGAAAQCLECIAAATTWADDYVTADQLYREASSLAEGMLASLQIADALDDIQPGVQAQRLNSTQQRSPITSSKAATRRPGAAGQVARLVSLLQRFIHSVAPTPYAGRLGRQCKGELHESND
jgi:hypothetical protein